jgi:hypothetical protein
VSQCSCQAGVSHSDAAYCNTEITVHLLIYTYVRLPPHYDLYANFLEVLRHARYVIRYVNTVACRPLLANDRQTSNYTTAVAWQRFRNRHERNNSTATRRYNNNGNRCFLRGPCRDVMRRTSLELDLLPCGGGVKYLHRSPESRRRRRKWKSRIWDSKLWSRVPRDTDSRMTALANASSSCKR